MRCFCLALCFGWAANLWGSAGSVRAVDGRTVFGDIRLTNGWLLVVSTNPEPARFAPADLLSVRFDEPGANASAPGGKGNGLLGFYFNNTNLDGSVVIRLDETIDFDWSIREPVPGVPADY